MQSHLDREVSPDHFFYCNDGRILKSIAELRDALSSMDGGLFSYHVNGNKNDFADWIREAAEDEGLAKSIENIRVSEKMVEKIDEMSTSVDDLKKEIESLKVQLQEKSMEIENLKKITEKEVEAEKEYKEKLESDVEVTLRVLNELLDDLSSEHIENFVNHPHFSIIKKVFDAYGVK